MLLLAVIAGLAILLAVPGGTASGRFRSGIFGRVLVGPPCPVSELPVNCREHPLRASIAVRRAGKRVTTMRSNAKGRFRHGLRPGTYRLVPRQTRHASASARSVRVRAGEFASVTVRYHSNGR